MPTAFIPRNHFFFLHGLSGAGKGEFQRVLIEEYQAQGYEVIAVSTGDLFREAKNDPVMAEQMRKGIFPASLAFIIPGLKEKYRQFLQAYQAKEGKAMIILDGAVRQSATTDKEGKPVPSQIDQIAQAFWEVQQEMGFAPETQTAELSDEIRGARHFIVDVFPEDAEKQMKIRVEKVMAQLREKLGDHIFPTHLAPQIIELLPQLIDSIIEVVDAEITAQNYDGLKKRFTELRQTMFLLAELTLSPSLLELLQKMDLVAELRDDDILSETRQKRISNLLYKEEDHYLPGFAAKALEEVGIRYLVAEQEFVASSENSRVIKNGQMRGIDFALFKRQCRELAQSLVSVDVFRERTKDGTANTEGVVGRKTPEN